MESQKSSKTTVLPSHLRDAAECVVEYMSDNLSVRGEDRKKVAMALRTIIAGDPTYFERFVDPDAFFGFVETLLLSENHSQNRNP